MIQDISLYRLDMAYRGTAPARMAAFSPYTAAEVMVERADHRKVGT